MTEIFYDVPMTDYRGWEEDSQSKVKAAVKSIEHYLTPFKETDAMSLGTAFHSEILTPGDGSYILAPEINRRTNAGKEEWAIFQREAEGKAIITQTQNETLKRMLDSCRASKRAMDLLNACNAFEVSARGKIEGLPFKGRIDAEIKSSNVSVDLKSTQDASPEAFAKSCHNFGYHVQQAAYNELWDRETMVFIVTENKEPFITEVYYLCADSVALGKRDLYEAIEKIKVYKETNIKTGYTNSSEPMEISLPGWAMRKGN